VIMVGIAMKNASSLAKSHAKIILEVRTVADKLCSIYSAQCCCVVPLTQEDYTPLSDNS